MTEPATTTLVTGAGSGIGAALVRTIAGPNTRLFVCGRDRTRLQTVVADAEARGAEVFAEAVDVRDRQQLQSWIARSDDRHPIDCIYVNAGVSAGLAPGRHRENDDDVDRMIDTNLAASIHSVGAIVERMRARRHGQIVLMASLAGRRPLADMPTYSAVKAGLIAYGQSIRQWLAPDNIGVTVICPGFVTSPMSARHHGAKPFEISADKAATLIVRAVAARRRVYAFPWQMAGLVWLAGLGPHWIVERVERSFGAEVAPDPRAELGAEHGHRQSAPSEPTG